MRPDLRKSTSFFKSCPKSGHRQFFKKVQRVHVGLLFKKICHQDFSKIAQSGHTGPEYAKLFGSELSLGKSSRLTK